jgi:hypothetical protein
MKTEFMLLAQYDGKVVIPIDTVCRDFFPHLNTTQLLRKTGAGEIDLPIIRMERSQKSHKGVHLLDLAAYVDKRRAAARRELDDLTR